MQLINSKMSSRPLRDACREVSGINVCTDLCLGFPEGFLPKSCSPSHFSIVLKVRTLTIIFLMRQVYVSDTDIVLEEWKVSS